MKHKGIVAVLIACMFALTLGLVACGGGGGGSAQNKEAFVGEWTLTGMESGGEVTSAEDLETLKSLGMEVTLTLSDDGTGELNLFGEAMSGTWEPKTATEASFTLEGDAVTMTLANGTLTLEQGNSKLEFQKA